MYVLRDDDLESNVAELVLSVKSILADVTLCSMARADAGGPWIATLFFAVLSDRAIVVLSDPSSRHFASVDGEDKVAVAVFDSHQVPDAHKQGLQVIGRVRQLTEPDEIDPAILRYCERFPSARAWLSDSTSLAQIDSRPFSIEFESVKVFDEVSFGPERWITIDWIDATG
jgi:uncharacterized protein YhbP (UPF0306 family)